MNYWEALRREHHLLECAETSIRSSLSALRPGDREANTVVAVGLGASFHAAKAAEASWYQRGLRLVTKSPLERLPSWATNSQDSVILVISQSGQTAELMSVFDRQGSQRVFAITASPNSPVARRASHVIDLGVPDDCAVRTAGFTATLLALDLFGSWWQGSLDSETLVAPGLPTVTPDIADFAADFTRQFAVLQSVDVVAMTDLQGLAGEASLLLREGARLPAAYYETHQYLHGPVEAPDTKCGVLLFGGDREERLARSLAAEGVPTAYIATGSGAMHGDHEFRGPRLSLNSVDPAYQKYSLAFAIQHCVGACAAQRRVNPGEFRRPQADTKLPW
jgi:glucosamine--fructose-6-phosphate aminotransferase (isomerizing)